MASTAADQFDLYMRLEALKGTRCSGDGDAGRCRARARFADAERSAGLCWAHSRGDSIHIYGPHCEYRRDEALWDQLQSIVHCHWAETPSLVARTIIRLPEAAAKFALRRCAYASVGLAAAAITFPARIFPWRRRGWFVILLDECTLEREGDDEALATIAHEIAHAWLDHDAYSLDRLEDPEGAAAALAGEWGFSGSATNPDFCRGHGGRPC
jgi:hypothetical protein